MGNEWFYAREGGKLGPFTADRLKELAGAGQILPTDTVWKEGLERGVLASRVQHLFVAAVLITPEQGIMAAPAPLQNPATIISPMAEAVRPEVNSVDFPATVSPPVDEPKQEAVTEPAPKPNEYNPQQSPAKKGRATAGRGAIIVSQDGFTVQYRKKCMRCNHEDASKNRMPIRSGMTRASYFCPKCRKLQQVEIQAIV
jgi:hypothetical protein